jgi:hypothetical protein
VTRGAPSGNPDSSAAYPVKYLLENNYIKEYLKEIDNGCQWRAGTRIPGEFARNSRAVHWRGMGGVSISPPDDVVK